MIWKKRSDSYKIPEYYQNTIEIHSKNKHFQDRGGTLAEGKQTQHPTNESRYNVTPVTRLHNVFLSETYQPFPTDGADLIKL
jgi:hypothetical protein